MFEEFKVNGHKVVSIGDEVLEFDVSHGKIKYSRGGIVKSVVTDSGRVRIIPSPVSGKYISFFIVYLEEEVVIPPGFGAFIWARAPFDVNVVIDDVVMDRFVVGKVKRCLYDGVGGARLVVGCSRSPVVVGKVSGKVLGGVNFSVKNDSRSTLVVRRLVMFVKRVQMFYDKDSVYYPWFKVSVEGDVAFLFTNFTSPVPNLKSSVLVGDRSFEVKINLEKRGSTLYL